jgi:hypothetical protein
MALIWNDGRLTPERMIEILERERTQWLETAESFDRLKTYLTGTFSLRDAEGSSELCRRHAAALSRTIALLRQEYQQPPIVPPRFPSTLFIQ